MTNIKTSDTFGENITRYILGKTSVKTKCFYKSIRKKEIS